MPERRRLSPRFVDEAEAPKTGERWIADTEVRGFGLRLWRVQSGVGRALALRFRDQDGHNKRLTYSPPRDPLLESRQRRAIAEWLDEPGYVSTGLGNFLEDARSWAREMLRRSKGEIDKSLAGLSLAQEEQKQRRAAFARLSSISVEHAVARVIAGARTTKRWSEAHADVLEAIFHEACPAALGRMPLEKLEQEHVDQLLEHPELSNHKRRHLRDLINQVFDRVYTCGGPRLLRFLPNYGEGPSVYRHDGISDQVRELSEDDFQPLFSRLEAEEQSWPEALALRMRFELRAPMSRILRAHWDQTIGDIWYPFREEERSYWHVRWERIDPPACAVLSRAVALLETDGQTSRYWFPRRSDPSCPVATISRMWEVERSRLGWPKAPLAEFARQYRSYVLFRYFEWGSPREVERRKQIASFMEFRREQRKSSNAHL